MIDPRLGSSLRQLREDGLAGRPLEASWQAFAAAARSIGGAGPVNVAFVLRELPAAPERPLRILDHGCGTGQSLLTLLALGHRDVYGIDIQERATWPMVRRVLREIHGIAEERLAVYEGGRLPYPDESFDAVFSQQVLEHVPDGAVETFYAEEARVLRPGGLACHEIPHRLMPFEGHTGLWLVHYLPGHRRLWGLCGVSAALADGLCMRWPARYLALGSRFLGPTRNVKPAQLHLPVAVDHFEGPVAVWRLARGVFRLPLLGRALARVLGGAFMMETVSVRRAGSPR